MNSKERLELNHICRLLIFTTKAFLTCRDPIQMQFSLTTALFIIQGEFISRRTSVIFGLVNAAVSSRKLWVLIFLVFVDF